MVEIWFCISLVAALAIAAAVLGCQALIEVKAMQRSTHSIEYVNPLADLVPGTKVNDYGEVVVPLTEEQKRRLEDDDNHNLI